MSAPPPPPSPPPATASGIARAPARAVHRVRTSCRACRAERLERVLELGRQPLANSFLRDLSQAAGEPRFPLDLYRCAECSLVQLCDVIDPELLFRDYIYVSGTSETMAAHHRAYARTVADLLRLGPGDLVVELASNDGSLLACFDALGAGARVLGIEPASNVAAMARERGIETLDVFFDGPRGAALRSERGQARAVVANNVLAHVDDTRDFLGGARALLAEDGLLVVEVPYVLEMLERLEYDTIYHEHLCYFSVSSLLRLCEAADLSVVRVDRVPVHGGSIRVYAGPPSRWGGHAAEVLRMVEQERAAGLEDADRWQRFARDVAAQREALLALLYGFVAEGRAVAGYGAPAKGNTLLNYCGIGPELLPWTVDRSPLKVGTWTPGSHIPVLAVEALAERRPDYVLLLAWNFAEEIARQQEAVRRGGTRFVLPLPAPRVM